jgi:hypothetical protein
VVKHGAYRELMFMRRLVQRRARAAITLLEGRTLRVHVERIERVTRRHE